MHSNGPYRYSFGGDQVSSMIGQYETYMLVARDGIQGQFWLLGNHFSLVTAIFYHILVVNMPYFPPNSRGMEYGI